MKTIVVTFLLAVLAVSVFLFYLRVESVNAANTIIVDSIADTATTDGDCTLREAISNANSDSDTTGGDCEPGFGADTIKLVVDGTITLTSNLPAVTSDMTIDGNQVVAAIDGASQHRIIEITENGALILERVNIQHGRGWQYDYFTIFNNSGSLTVKNSTFTENWGAILNTGKLTVTNSTLVQNSTIAFGGAIRNESSGVATVSNSTFTRNSGLEPTGPIYNSGTLTVTNNTFVENNGGVANSGIAYLAGNVFSNFINCWNFDDGVLIDNGYNLSSDTNCNFSGTGSVNSATLDFDMLSDNGGLTFTFALLPGSIALNNIPPESCFASTDQRGQARPFGDGCDSGAYEAQIVCDVTENKIYKFDAIEIAFAPSGTGDIECVQVKPYEKEHPDATAGLQTGSFWQIIATNSEGETASGYNAILSAHVPFTPTSFDELCRYADAGWDCAVDSYDPEAKTITRRDITQFSDWTVREVGPTAVAIQSLEVKISHPSSPATAVLISAGMVILCILLFRRKHICQLPKRE